MEEFSWSSNSYYDVYEVCRGSTSAADDNRGHWTNYGSVGAVCERFGQRNKVMQFTRGKP